MHPAEQRKIQRLLDEMVLLNDRLTVQHRASMKELARNRARVAHLQEALDHLTTDDGSAPEAEQELAEFLIEQTRED